MSVGTGARREANPRTAGEPRGHARRVARPGRGVGAVDRARGRRRRRGRRDGTPSDDVGATVQAVAVLLEAGVSPAQAWRHVAAAGDPVAAAVDANLAAAGDVADALAARGRGWRQVAVTWRIAQTVGAPLAPSLRAIAAAERDAQESRDDVRVALAEPAATARLVAWLPAVAVLLALALGFDIARTFTQPLGVACLVVGIVLMLVARSWTGRLVARAQPDDTVPGLTCELLAIALSAGASIDRAIDVLGACGGGSADEDARRVLTLSETAGAPAVELLRAQAQTARHDARTRGRLRASALSSRLLLPLGACTLPAFLALGVGPMMLSVLSSTTMPT